MLDVVFPVHEFCNRRSHGYVVRRGTPSAFFDLSNIYDRVTLLEGFQLPLHHLFTACFEVYRREQGLG